MAKKLLIKSPQTIDGNTLEYDENDRPVLKHTIAELGARRHFESLNGNLPTHLRHKLEEVEVDEKGNIVKPEKKAAKEDSTAKPADGKKASDTKKGKEESTAKAGGENDSKDKTAGDSKEGDDPK